MVEISDNTAVPHLQDFVPVTLVIVAECGEEIGCQLPVPAVLVALDGYEQPNCPRPLRGSKVNEWGGPPSGANWSRMPSRSVGFTSLPGAVAV